MVVETRRLTAKGNDEEEEEYSTPQNTGIMSSCTFLFFSVLYLYTFCPDCRGFPFCPLLYNTNIHAPGGIRTCNPSKPSAADHSATGIATCSAVSENGK
jgi:hypothetical protein